MEAEKRPFAPDRVIRCGAYDIDLEAGELYRHGRKIGLQEQPFKVLAILLARPGVLVTREMLQAELWGEHPLIDTEQGLNTAIRKLRLAFRDPAENSRFIETIPKRGYRFIGLLRGPSPVNPEEAIPAPLPPAKHAVAHMTNSLEDELALTTREPTATVAIRSAGAEAFRSKWLAWLLVALLVVGVAAVSAVQMSTGGAVSIQPAPGMIGGSKHPDIGVGGYDLRSRNDRAFSFDYDHSGKLDHLVFYRPGAGFIWILRRSGGAFLPVYVGEGLGDYDLKSAADRVLAFDYEHSGRQDHLLIYRPGAGVLRILRSEGNGLFTPVYHGVSSDDPAARHDQIFAFDYEHSGRLDHLMFYRPGQGIVEIWTNVAGRWSAVKPRSTQDADVAKGRPLGTERALPFDYDHSGKLDHLLIYRPGDGTVTILKNDDAVFAPVLEARGLGSFDLKSVEDHAVAVDYDRSGKLDHILLYRPGSGLAVILKNADGTFSPVYEGRGLAGYDLMSPSDRALALDFEGSGKLDHLVLYRPGTGIARLVRLR